MTSEDSENGPGLGKTGRSPRSRRTRDCRSGEATHAALSVPPRKPGNETLGHTARAAPEPPASRSGRSQEGTRASRPPRRPRPPRTAHARPAPPSRPAPTPGQWAGRGAEVRLSDSGCVRASRRHPSRVRAAGPPSGGPASALRFPPRLPLRPSGDLSYRARRSLYFLPPRCGAGQPPHTGTRSPLRPEMNAAAEAEFNILLATDSYKVEGWGGGR